MTTLLSSVKDWPNIMNNLQKKIAETTPTLPEINHMKTRKAIKLINDKTGTHRVLQQMNYGEYAGTG
eukprot:COSAG02_NODE_10120_length_2017_cov_1.633472_3_plen_67_part_00